MVRFTLHLSGTFNTTHRFVEKHSEVSMSIAFFVHFSGINHVYYIYLSKCSSFLSVVMVMLCLAMRAFFPLFSSFIFRNVTFVRISNQFNAFEIWNSNKRNIIHITLDTRHTTEPLFVTLTWARNRNMYTMYIHNKCNTITVAAFRTSGQSQMAYCINFTFSSTSDFCFFFLLLLNRSLVCAALIESLNAVVNLHIFIPPHERYTLQCGKC